MKTLRFLYLYTVISLFSISTTTPSWYPFSGTTNKNTNQKTEPTIINHQDIFDQVQKELPEIAQALKSTEIEHKNYHKFITTQNEEIKRSQEKFNNAKVVSLANFKNQREKCAEDYRQRINALNNDDNFIEESNRLIQELNTNKDTILANEQNSLAIQTNIDQDFTTVTETFNSKLNSIIIEAQADVVEDLKHRNEQWFDAFSNSKTAPSLHISIDGYAADIAGNHVCMQYPLDMPIDQQIPLLTSFALKHNQNDTTQVNKTIGKASCNSVENNVRCIMITKDFEDVLKLRNEAKEAHARKKQAEKQLADLQKALEAQEPIITPQNQQE